jgi:transmembrane sensor
LQRRTSQTNQMRSETIKTPSAAARAEAAVWIARLHGPNRTLEVEAGFRKWLEEDSERAAAFELMTDTWEKVAILRRNPSDVISGWQRMGIRLSPTRAVISFSATILVAVVATLLYIHSSAVTTGIGEQRTLSLEDGTRVYLNTNTRAVVHYDKNTRRVDLQNGEAMFEVAKRPDWPFVVTAGDRQIRALGTEFIVRRDDDELMVTLVEGRVTVSPVGAGESMAAEKEVLNPGQRLTFVGASKPKLDNPPIEKVTAWQRGQVAFDDTPLPEAISEMNRYSKIRLVLTLDASSVSHVHISGLFRAGDSEDFAQAIAKTYSLELRRSKSELVLAETESTSSSRLTPDN